MPPTPESNDDQVQAAARLTADVTLAHLADVYAEALLGAAQSAGETDTLVEELAALVDQVLRPNPRLGDVFASPWIDADEKIAMVDRVFGGRVSNVLLNALKVIARHGRLDCLEAIQQRVQALYDERHGRIPVELTTAEAVNDTVAQRLSGTLTTMLGREPILHRHVDPKLIGGAVLRVGDKVYDGSIFNQLQTLREQLIDRTVHEIQGGRNRFRDSAGD